MSPFQSPAMPIHGSQSNQTQNDLKRRQTYHPSASYPTTNPQQTNNAMKFNPNSQASTLMSPAPTQSNPSLRSMTSPTPSTASSTSNASRRSISSNHSTNSSGSNGFHRVRLLHEDPDNNLSGTNSSGQDQQHGIRISHPERDILLMQSPIKHGDVLLSIANIAIQSPEDYTTVINNNITIGQPFFVVIRRDNAQVYTYSFTIEGKNDPQPDGTITFKKKTVEVSNRVATNSFFDCRPYYNF
jgi:hypothetical protein